jgi:hypothetical protein
MSVAGSCELAGTIEAASETVVFADPTDLTLLADLRRGVDVRVAIEEENEAWM